MSTRVILADDHRIVREGLAALLAADGDFTVVAQARDGHEALALARKLTPEVVVADVSMPGLNGIELVRRLRGELPSARVLSLSVHDEEKLVLAMIEAGASGYVLKDASFSDLAGAIREVMAGRIYLSPALVGIFVTQYRTAQRSLLAEGTGRAHDAAAGAGARGHGGTRALTPRERELVQLFSEGYTTAEIAERLHVSPKTVATHRENVLEKLQLRGVAELTRYALREGISSLDAPCRSRA